MALCVGLVSTLLQAYSAAAATSPYPPGVWSSGAETENLTEFANWRGRPLDNSGTWPGRDNFDTISNPDTYSQISGGLVGLKQISIGVAMLPEQQTASFAECANGSYDQYYRTLGRNLKTLGRDSSDTFIRLGWEANGNWFAWSIGRNIAYYKKCFRHQSQAIKSTAPNVQIDWNMNKESVMGSRSVADAYPGDDVVDVVGVDFYSHWPAYPDQAAWDADYMRTQNGGPRGLGTWLAFAKQHGKKLSVPEWGLHNGKGGGGDDAFFIGVMYNFFSANSSDIAYETYFNLSELSNPNDPSFMIYPGGVNPNASAKYQQLWSASPRP
jgi:hypothetical protein